LEALLARTGRLMATATLVLYLVGNR
jgi:hypothetical protein